MVEAPSREVGSWGKARAVAAVVVAVAILAYLAFQLTDAFVLWRSGGIPDIRPLYFAVVPMLAVFALLAWSIRAAVAAALGAFAAVALVVIAMWGIAMWPGAAVATPALDMPVRVAATVLVGLPGLISVLLVVAEAWRNASLLWASRSTPPEMAR